MAALALAQPASAPSPTRQPPVLTSFALNEGGTAAVASMPLRISHTVVGTAPSAFRISTRADFVGATWLPYLRQPEVQPSTFPSAPGCDAHGSARRLRLFLQVRSSLGDEVRIVNGQRTLAPVMAESNVMVDSICLSGSPRP